MIRFACETCRRTLRAPDSLAGKRGKCARCGGVNLVPAPLVVDVKRAAEPSPFRDPDQPVRGAIEGAIQVTGGQFLAVAPAAVKADNHDGDHVHPHDFYEQVAPRLADDDGEFSVDVPPPLGAPTAPSSRCGRGRHEQLQSHGPPGGEVYELHYDSHRGEFTRAVSAALIVGAVVGFCLGLIASRWIL